MAAKLVGILVTITGVLAALGAWHALLADAANQRTDVLASGAALVGALGGRAQR